MYIDQSAICTLVYMITANAAQQSGGAVAAATEDNKAVIATLTNEGLLLVGKAFGRYLVGISGAILSYSMPSNWPDGSAELAECVDSFLTNYTVSRWYNLGGKEYADKAEVAYERIKELLDKRSKPTR